MARLIGADLLVLEHTGVVLDDPVGHDDVADRQRRVQSARHTGENDCAATEPIGQQRGDDRSVDLAHPRPGQYHVVAVENPGDESCMRHRLGVSLV